MIRTLLLAFAITFAFYKGFAQPRYVMSTTTVTDTIGYLFDDGDSSGNYTADKNYQFTINVGAGKTLRLQWQQFSVETNEAGASQACVYDYVEIFEGDAGTDNPANRYCGNTPPPDFTATSGKITIVFVSDGATEMSGFKAYWTTGDLPQVMPGYCYGSGPSCADAFHTIGAVNVGSQTYTNNTCNDDPNTGKAYTDYTNLVFNVNSGAQYTSIISVINAIGYEVVDVYFDWNSDGDFDDPLEKYSGNIDPVFGEFTYAFTVPTGMAQGYKRMRVRTWDEVFELGIAGPCGESAYGEVEDYSVLYLDPARPLPPCATTVYPTATDSTVCINSKLIWRTASSATSYKVTLATSSGTALFTDVSTTDTTMLIGQYLSPGTDYRYTVKPVNANGTATGCTPVTFSTAPNPDPVASILPSSDTIQACPGELVSLNGNPSLGTPVYNHNWTSSGGVLGSPAAGITTFSAEPGSYNAVYTVTDEFGCSGRDSVTIVFNPAPSYTGPNPFDASLCLGEATYFTLNMDPGTGVMWEESTDSVSWMPAVVTAAGSNRYDISSITESTYYRAIVTANETGCNDTSEISLILVNPLPFAPAINVTQKTVNCTGETVVLQVATAEKVRWNDPDETEGFTLNVTKSGTYAATIISDEGCENTTSPVTITFFPAPPTPTIAVQGKNPACEGETVVLSVSTSDAVTWSPGNITGNSITVTNPGTFSATVTNASGCTSTSGPAAISFLPRPAQPEILQDGHVLSSNTSAGSYQWFSDAGPIPGATGQSYTPLADGNYRLVIFSADGCASDTSDVFYYSTVGLTEYIDLKVVVFPNPASSVINIISDLEGTVSLTSLAGQKIWDRPLAKGLDKIDTSTLPSGTYMLLIMSGDRQDRRYVTLLPK